MHLPDLNLEGAEALEILAEEDEEEKGESGGVGGGSTDGEEPPEMGGVVVEDNDGGEDEDEDAKRAWKANERNFILKSAVQRACEVPVAQIASEVDRKGEESASQGVNDARDEEEDVEGGEINMEDILR